MYETNRETEVRESQAHVQVQKLMGRTTDRFKAFNVLYVSAALGALAVVPRESDLGHFSLSFEELSSKVWRLVQAIIGGGGGGEPTMLLGFLNCFYLYLFYYLFLKKTLKDLTWNFSKCLLIYSTPKKGDVVGILGHLSLQFGWWFLIYLFINHFPPGIDGIDLIPKFDTILAIIEAISTSHQFYPSE